MIRASGMSAGMRRTALKPLRLGTRLYPDFRRTSRTGLTRGMEAITTKKLFYVVTGRDGGIIADCELRARVAKKRLRNPAVQRFESFPDARAFLRGYITGITPPGYPVPRWYICNKMIVFSGTENGKKEAHYYGV